MEFAGCISHKVANQSVMLEIYGEQLIFCHKDEPITSGKGDTSGVWCCGYSEASSLNPSTSINDPGQLHQALDVCVKGCS